jgi:hypothetical protein
VLDACQVAHEAEQAALSLPVAWEEGFDSYLTYVLTDEPAIHLLPLHFLPAWLQDSVDHVSLHGLAVAAKLEYARNRWLDEMVDNLSGLPALPSAVHRLNETLLDVINSRYAKILNDGAALSFFPTLASLHARHGLSLIIDATQHPAWPQHPPRMSLEDYIEHARARHGPIRASVDAVLLLAGATEDELWRARASWHNAALGLQFYDDALDVEEDYAKRGLSWVVSRTLECLARKAGDHPAECLPDPDLFYETALTAGVVSEALTHAEEFFAESARLAESTFPSWAAFQRALLSKARQLREDYDALVAEAEQKPPE